MSLAIIIAAIFVITAFLAIIYLIYDFYKNYHLASSEERILAEEADHFDELAKKYGEAAKKYDQPSNVIPFRPRRPPTLAGQTGAEGWDANGSSVVDSSPAIKDSASHNIGPTDNS